MKKERAACIQYHQPTLLLDWKYWFTWKIINSTECLIINQRHPTTIFGKYLFGRRFEIPIIFGSLDFQLGWKYPYIYRLNTKIRLTMLCFSGFELYSRWVPLYLAPKEKKFTVVMDSDRVVYQSKITFAGKRTSCNLWDIRGARSKTVTTQACTLRAFFASSQLPASNLLKAVLHHNFKSAKGF